ncbi:hypothetical protein Emed_001057 [Eimeria media]
MEEEGGFPVDSGGSVTQTFASSYSEPWLCFCLWLKTPFICLLHATAAAFAAVAAAAGVVAAAAAPAFPLSASPSVPIPAIELPLPGGSLCAVPSSGFSLVSSFLSPHLFLAFTRDTNRQNEGHFIIFEAETFEASLLSRFSLEAPSSAVSLLHLRETDKHADVSLLLALDTPSPSLCLYQGSSPLSETETEDAATHSSSSNGSSNSNSSSNSSSSSSSGSSSGSLSVVQTLTGPAPFRQIHAYEKRLTRLPLAACLSNFISSAQRLRLPSSASHPRSCMHFNRRRLQQSPDGVGPRALCVADSEKDEEFQVSIHLVKGSFCCSPTCCCCCFSTAGKPSTETPLLFALLAALGILQQEHATCEAAAWDPHDASVLLTAHSKSRLPSLRRTGGSSGGFLTLWDLRQPLSESAAAAAAAAAPAAAAAAAAAADGGRSSCMRLVDETEDPHSLRASPTTICFNPNIPFCFISGGTDGAIRCWDKRKLQLPVKSALLLSCEANQTRLLLLHSSSSSNCSSSSSIPDLAFHMSQTAPTPIAAADDATAAVVALAAAAAATTAAAPIAAAAAAG